MITVSCDGGSRGNPGHSAYGYVVKEDDQIVKEGNGYIGIATNNFAEYTAVLEAFKWLSSNYKGKEINFFLDSNLVVSQLNGLFKIKNQDIRTFVIKIKDLEKNFSKVTYKHIPRERNKEADKLVNMSLDKKIYGI